jgi:hypothetical protein
MAKFTIDFGEQGLQVWKDTAKVKLPPEPPSKRWRIITIPPAMLWEIKLSPNYTTKYSLYNAKGEWIRGAGNSAKDWKLMLADLMHENTRHEGPDPLMQAYRWTQHAIQGEAPRIRQERVEVQFHWFKEGDNVLQHIIEHPKRTLDEALFVARQEGFEVIDWICVKK